MDAKEAKEKNILKKVDGRRSGKRKNLKEMHRDGEYLLIYDEWCRNGQNALEAVKKIRPDISDSRARDIWRKVENSDTVRTVAKNRINKRTSRSYMNVEERKAFLTEVILGEREPDAETKDRLKAIQILNNMEGIGTPQILAQQNIQMNQTNISVEDKRTIINQRLNEILGISSDEEERKEEEENE